MCWKSSKSLTALIITFLLTYVVTEEEEGPPDMCSHSSRMDSLTQFLYFDNIRIKVGFFFASKGFYWILMTEEFPTLNNTRGRLPHGFRGDAAFFRQWKRCEDQVIVPMIVVVDSNQLDLKYMIYFIHNQTWTQPFNASEDKALGKIKLYDGLKTVDTIINFSNIKTGPFADKLGDESIFIISSAQNNSIYYDWVGLTGCLETEDKFEFKGNAIQFFGGLLERGFWKMNKSIDAAMVYTQYPNDPELPKEADLSMFQENTHYQFTVPLILIENGLLYCDKKWLLAQYYSTWMGCADGLTPEPPIQISYKTTTNTPIPTNYSDEVDSAVVNATDNSTHKWRPTLVHGNPLHNEDSEEENTLYVTLISGVMVIVVAIVLIIIILYMFVFKSDKQKEKH